MIWRRIVYVWLFLTVALMAGQYDFDASAFEKKPYSINGNIELRPSLAFLSLESESYKAKYGTDGEPGFLDTYLSRLELSADYYKGPFLFYASGLGFAQYERYDSVLDYDVYLYEAYGRLGFESTSMNLWLGKKTFKWGKGYVFNPTAFAARPKDVNDVEASLEGYWSLSGEFIRAFSGRISTLSLNVAIIPEFEKLNGGFIGEDGLAGAGQLYVLAFDTDIDLCFYLDKKKHTKVGFGFSRNIFSNLEVHGEAAYIPYHQATAVTIWKNLETIQCPAYNALLGFRYLTTLNTTIIAEYVRNGQGFSNDQMSAYYSALENRNELSPDIRNFMSLNADRYMGQFAMRNYIYTKISHSEPFGILYLTPSAYTMANIDDASLMAAFEIAYTRFKNISLAGKILFFHGNDKSEFGNKMKRTQWEIRAKYFF